MRTQLGVMHAFIPMSWAGSARSNAGAKRGCARAFGCCSRTR